MKRIFVELKRQASLSVVAPRASLCVVRVSIATLLALGLAIANFAANADIVGFGARPAMADEPKVEEGFARIFDGKTLSGWEGKAGVFRVVEGAIVAGTLKERIPNNEFLCTTEQYGDFELRLQAKLVGAGENAGIQFRSARIPNHHEVIGFQCDMGRMNGKPIWGWLYDESRRKKFLVESEPAPLSAVLKADGWNDLVIRCQGPRIELYVNGLKTCDYLEKDDKIARRGVIGLQIHGGAPAEASYRDIRIKKLD